MARRRGRGVTVRLSTDEFKLLVELARTCDDSLPDTARVLMTFAMEQLLEASLGGGPADLAEFDKRLTDLKRPTRHGSSINREVGEAEELATPRHGVIAGSVPDLFA